MESYGKLSSEEIRVKMQNNDLYSITQVIHTVSRKFIINSIKCDGNRNVFQ